LPSRHHINNLQSFPNKPLTNVFFRLTNLNSFTSQQCILAHTYPKQLILMPFLVEILFFPFGLPWTGYDPYSARILRLLPLDLCGSLYFKYVWLICHFILQASNSISARTTDQTACTLISYID
jgi:hypothetical protein